MNNISVVDSPAEGVQRRTRWYRISKSYTRYMDFIFPSSLSYRSRSIIVPYPPLSIVEIHQVPGNVVVTFRRHFNQGIQFGVKRGLSGAISLRQSPRATTPALIRRKKMSVVDSPAEGVHGRNLSLLPSSLPKEKKRKEKHAEGNNKG